MERRREIGMEVKTLANLIERRMHQIAPPPEEEGGAWTKMQGRIIEYLYSNRAKGDLFQHRAPPADGKAGLPGAGTGQLRCTVKEACTDPKSVEPAGADSGGHTQYGSAFGKGANSTGSG